MNRKQRRAAAKAAKNQQNTNIEIKLSIFDKLTDECSACTKPYDKTDKQMAMTWSVVVREKENVVRLYCPDCWSMAKNAIEILKEEIENAGQ